MVTSVKESLTNLHVIKLVISEEGCRLESVCNNKTESRYVRYIFQRVYARIHSDPRLPIRMRVLTHDTVTKADYGGYLSKYYHKEYCGRGTLR